MASHPQCWCWCWYPKSKRDRGCTYSGVHIFAKASGKCVHQNTARSAVRKQAASNLCCPQLAEMRRRANVCEVHLIHWTLRALLCFLDVLPIAICMQGHVRVQHKLCMPVSTALEASNWSYLSNLVKPEKAHNLYANSSDLYVSCITTKHWHCRGNAVVETIQQRLCCQCYLDNYWAGGAD